MTGSESALTHPQRVQRAEMRFYAAGDQAVRGMPGAIDKVKKAFEEFERARCQEAEAIIRLARAALAFAG